MKSKLLILALALASFQLPQKPVKIVWEHIVDSEFYCTKFPAIGSKELRRIGILNYNILNKEGEGSFTIFRLDGLRIKGNFNPAKQLSIDSIPIQNILTGEESIRVDSSYKAVPAGVWSYYYGDYLFKQYIFEHGVKIDSVYF